MATAFLIQVAMVSFITRIRRRLRRAPATVGGNQRMFTWGVLVGAVFAAVGLPLLAPGVLSARNQTPYDTVDDLRLSALPLDKALLLSEISLQNNRRPLAVAREETVKNGSNLMETLLRAGVPGAEAHQAIVALQDVFDPRALRAGQRIQVALDTESDLHLVSVVIPLDAVRTVVAHRIDEKRFFSEAIEKPLSLAVVATNGLIQDSLFQAMNAEGVPDRLIMDLIRIYSWDVDFQRDIQRNDRFEIMFETHVDPDGNRVKTGNILMASLSLSGTELRLIRHELADGNVDYFNENGESVRKALLRTPVDGARLSSRYGKRKHPILGYTRMHRGVDFSAPRGTPVMAAGDGVVEFAGTNGAYGRYLRIRHNASYKSAYAHLKGFSKGVRVGTRVKQGQIVAYVGTTGMSTGPHLHYEIHRGTAQINPLSLKLPTGQKLAGDALRAFQSNRTALEATFAGLIRPLQTAAND
ncbi:MAG: M23 family metallopeptidase [Proteobacteria bacterium]|nr:M23 family metallopeptidase [Pseudomonadota bacterium]MDA1057494.1 M23 family metallopeptidase [Pseudomonadota bacterium]